MPNDAPEPLVASTRYVRAETPRRYRSPDRGAIGVGWAPLVEAIMMLLDVAAPGWVLRQVKQDLGWLDVYYEAPETSDPLRVRAAHDAIAATRNLASVTCEICGTPGRQVMVNGWLSVFCDQHADHTGPIPIVRYLTEDARPSPREPSAAERQQDRELDERIRAAAANADFSQPYDPDNQMMLRALAASWQSGVAPTTSEPHELVRDVRQVLGSKLTAYMADASMATLRRWANPDNPTNPPPDVLERLHVAQNVATSITRYDSPAVAQAWFLGSAADGTAPARRIREGNPTEVERELLARLADARGRPPSQ